MQKDRPGIQSILCEPFVPLFCCGIIWRDFKMSGGHLAESAIFSPYLHLKKSAP
jgi:hypothetical protein